MFPEIGVASQLGDSFVERYSNGGVSFALLVHEREAGARRENSIFDVSSTGML